MTASRRDSTFYEFMTLSDLGRVWVKEKQSRLVVDAVGFVNVAALSSAWLILSDNKRKRVSCPWKIHHQIETKPRCESISRIHRRQNSQDFNSFFSFFSLRICIRRDTRLFRQNSSTFFPLLCMFARLSLNLSMSLASLCVSFFATSEIYFHSSHNYLAVQLAHEEEDEDGLGKKRKREDES